MNARTTFTSFQDSTAQDWQLIAGEFVAYASRLPDRVIAHLKLLKGDFGGFPIDRYAHSLQTATHALRDGRAEEYVVRALLHDIGDTLGTYNHPDIAAAILKPFISDANLWLVGHHGIFQGYYFHHLGMDRNLRDRFSGQPHYDYTAEFCESYDSPSFDAKAEILPLQEFEPILRRVLAVSKRSLYQAETPATRPPEFVHNHPEPPWKSNSLEGSVSAEEWRLRCDLATCYRLVAAAYGWSDLVFTHISARIPGPEHSFLINPYGLLFEEVTASSLVAVDQEGNKLR